MTLIISLRPNFKVNASFGNGIYHFIFQQFKETTFHASKCILLYLQNYLSFKNNVFALKLPWSLTSIKFSINKPIPFNTRQIKESPKSRKVLIRFNSREGTFGLFFDFLNTMVYFECTYYGTPYIYTYVSVEWKNLFVAMKSWWNDLI